MSSPQLSLQEKRLVKLFSVATRSVVVISTFSKKSILDPAADDKVANPEGETDVPFGTGSGFVYKRNESCYILTSYHVICNSSGAQVVTSNQIAHTAVLKGYDGSNDIAVLEIDAPKKDMVPIKMGTSLPLAVGQSAYAIGNPFGLDHSLTSGIISGIGRKMKSPTGHVIHACIQTDCNTSPGSSGGPLLNSSGEVIGMNTAIYSPNGRSAGIFFAVPVDTVKQIADDIIDKS